MHFSRVIQPIVSYLSIRYTYIYIWNTKIDIYRSVGKSEHWLNLQRTMTFHGAKINLGWKGGSFTAHLWDHKLILLMES